MIRSYFFLALAALLCFSASLAASANQPAQKGVLQDKAPWFCHDLNCPPFTTQETLEGGFELRNYAAGDWVSTNITDMGYDRAMNTGFMRLFAYISGGNVEGKKIDMTAPVRARVVPGPGPTCESYFTVSFFVPFDLQGKAPQPSSDLVFIQPSGPASYWVLSYSGWASEKTMLNRALVVIKALDDAGKKYDASYFFSAGYDSPFRLTGRHNEVWIPAL